MPQPNSGSITRSPLAVLRIEIDRLLDALLVARLRDLAARRDLQREFPADAEEVALIAACLAHGDTPRIASAYSESPRRLIAVRNRWCVPGVSAAIKRRRKGHGHRETRRAPLPVRRARPVAPGAPRVKSWWYLSVVLIKRQHPFQRMSGHSD